MSLLIMLCESIIFAESLTILGGILSGPLAIFGFMSLIILFISFAVACGNQKC